MTVKQQLRTPCRAPAQLSVSALGACTSPTTLFGGTSQVRQRKPGVKQVFVEERRYDTLDESNSDGDAPKMPATLPGNPSAEGIEIDTLLTADLDVLDMSGPEPTFTTTGEFSDVLQIMCIGVYMLACPWLVPLAKHAVT